VSDLIAALDNAQRVNSQEIGLRRTVGVGASKQVIQVTLRATVNEDKIQELAGNTVMDGFTCIISPTEIDRAQWPGGQLPGGTEDPRIPSKNLGDQIKIQGRWRNVERAKGFYPEGFPNGLVRIEVEAIG
jgi:hypothetical protein